MSTFRFVRVHAFVRQTDGQTQTDRQTSTAIVRSNRVRCALKTMCREDRHTAYVRLVAPSVESIQNAKFDTQQRYA